MKNKPIELSQEIKQSMDKIDQLESRVPELNYFTELINQEAVTLRRKQNMQFTLFLGCAIILMSLIFFSLVTYTMFFLLVQGLSILTPMLWFTFYQFHKKERVR